MKHRLLQQLPMWLPHRKKIMRRWRHCRNISRREADLRQKKFFHFLRKQSFPEQPWMMVNPMLSEHRNLYCAASLRNIRNRLQSIAVKVIEFSFLANTKEHYLKVHWQNRSFRWGLLCLQIQFEREQKIRSVTSQKMMWRLKWFPEIIRLPCLWLQRRPESKGRNVMWMLPFWKQRVIMMRQSKSILCLAEWHQIRNGCWCRL